MRSKIILGLLATAAVTSASPALATASYTFQGGTGGIPGGETTYATFEPGSTGNPTGSGFDFLSPPSSGQGAVPAYGSTGRYLSVFANGTAMFSFAANPLQSLGFDFGSADDYNIFTLGFADGTTQVLTGDDLNGAPAATGNQSVPETNGRVTLNAGGGPAITSFTIQSRQNSAEVDNFGIRAVPEPATWAMMLVGFGAVGFSMRRRSRGVLQAA